MAAPGLVFEPASTAFIRDFWRERWHDDAIVSIDRTYHPEDVAGLVARKESGGEVLGLVTWSADGYTAEITSLDALRPGEGVGSALLEEAEANLRSAGVTRLTLVTTNDNVGAIGLYLRSGWRLVRLDLDGMDRVRSVKPDVVAVGANGIPLRDMWELEKQLD